jgi:hypothetical protein
MRCPLDKAIFSVMTGDLGDACLTNPHLRECAARIMSEKSGYVFSVRQFCIRYEELWMWTDRVTCRGGKCKIGGKKYNPYNPKCHECLERHQKKILTMVSDDDPGPFDLAGPYVLRKWINMESRCGSQA